MTDGVLAAAPDGRFESRLGAAFRQQEQEGLRLAAILRAVATAAIIVWLFVLLRGAAAFYVPILLLFAASGVAQYRLARRGISGDGIAIGFFMVDVALVTFALLAPNPMLSTDTFVWPPQMSFRFGSFNYYYILIGLFVLGRYSPRAVLLAGLGCTLAWTVGLVWISTLPGTTFEIPSFDESAERMQRFLDPFFVSLDVRITEIIVMLLTTAILATAVARGRRLIHEQVLVARERSNLARYFPPNIVDELAGYDGALDTVQSQDVAVLFADVVGFSRMAETVTPEELIELLRALHARMERAVFDNGGTLDKYLGDGVMATFGTPRAGPQDPANALRCARALLRSVDEWNVRRRAGGYPEVRLAVGVHYGRVVMGDIGSERRLEFAVIGDTVNVAARLEEATRGVGCRLLVSDALMQAVQESRPADLAALRADIVPHEGLTLRGRAGTIDAWILKERETSGD